MQQLQVTVTDATGAVKEDGSIVSIRAASSRRQGVVQLKRALHFPVPMADASPFKVDVLKKVGEGEITVRAEDADYDCVLKQIGTSLAAMNLKLQIRSAPHLCGRSRQELKVGASAPLSTNVPEMPLKEPAPTMPAELTAQSAAWPELQQAQQGAAVQARQYFDNHNIMRLVQALLEALIRDQPQEPFSYIGTFMDRLSEALQQKPPVKAAEDALEGTDTCAVAREQNPEWTAIFDANQKQGVVGVDDFCTAIRSVHPHLSTEQAKALCKGIASGDTGVNLAGFCAAANSVAEGNAMAAEVAGMSASKFAELGTSQAGPASGKDMNTVRSQMRELLVTSLEDGRLERSLTANAFEKVREKAAETLSAAAQDGTLEQALDSIKKVQPPDEQVPENPPPPSGPQAVLETPQEDLDQTRQKVKSALVQACDDGRLHTTLRELWQTRTNKDVNQDELEKIREKARGMLLESAANGRLHAELCSIKNGQQSVAQQAELDKIFEKLRGVLVETSGDGRLEEALKKICRPDGDAKALERLEDLKRQASDTLTKAFYDGRLADALESSKKARQGMQTPDFEQVRLKTKQMLTAACEDGSLEKALRDSVAEAEAGGDKPEEDNDVADMVRNLLVSAAMDGRLEESLNKMGDADAGNATRDLPDALLTSRAEEKEPECGPMDFQPLDFHFDRSIFCMIDEDAFKKEFMESLEFDAEVDPAVLNRLVITLREGSVIARLHGPSATMAQLRKASLEVVKVQGEYPRIEEVETTVTDETFMDLQSRALSALVTASKDGTLQNALTDVRNEKEKQSKSPTDIMFDAIDTDKDNWISRAELKEALKNGTLAQLIGGGALAPPAAAPPAAAPADEGANASSIDDIRLEMKQLLSAACDSGALEKALVEVKAPPNDEGRGKDDIRLELKKLLEDSCESGVLAQALAEVKAAKMGKEAVSDVDALKEKMRAILLESGDSGQLSTALDAVKASRQEANTPRSKADIRLELKQLLEDSCDSGVLAQALAEIKATKMGNKSKPPEVTSRDLPADFFAAPPPQEREATSEKRDPAQADEAKAAPAQTVRGQPEKPGSEFEVIKEKARQALVNSAMDGSLTSVLESQRSKALEKVPFKDYYGRYFTGASIIEGFASSLFDSSVKKAATKPAPTKSARDNKDLQAIREKAKSALTNAAIDGSLREALATKNKAVAKEAVGDVDALKEKMRAILLESGDSGQLSTALDAVKASRKDASAPAKQEVKEKIQKQKTRDRMTIGGDPDDLGFASRELPQAVAGVAQDDDKYTEVRQLAGTALVQAVKDGRLDTAVRPDPPRRPSATRLTDGMNFDNLVRGADAATGSTAPASSDAAPAEPAAAPPAAASASSAQSSRHADLLMKQRELLEQKQAYEAQLRELKAKKSLKPVPPSGSKPSSKRPLGSTVSYRELKEVNSGLCSENARLNAEMARLLARLAEAGK